MTLPESLILASYFFVLVILAVYGWHRYYMVYLYMKHKDEVPVPQGHFDDLPVVTYGRRPVGASGARSASGPAGTTATSQRRTLSCCESSGDGRLTGPV
mgnify:CR=1 FL=1